MLTTVNERDRILCVDLSKRFRVKEMKEVEARQVFVCQNCFRQHVRTGTLVSEHISCSCGYTFYAFGKEGLSLVLPSPETQDEMIGYSIRRMIASTGRIHDPELERGSGEYTAVLREWSPEQLMDVALERLQEETYGMNILKTKNILLLCELLDRGIDVAVKYKQDKDRVIMNKLDSTDLMAEYDKRHERTGPGAADSRRKPARWQINGMRYFGPLEKTS